MRTDRRTFLAITTAGVTTAVMGIRVGRGQGKPVRIGYTLSATGPYSVGAGITQAPNYALWADQVNAKGGLAIKGEGRRPVEYVTTDDRSEIETAVRFYEKLMGDDKVDLILPPWGTAMNFAVAPIANKYGYPMIGPTVSSNKLKELSLPYFYAILQQPDSLMQAMVEWLAELKAQGKVSKLGLAYVNDLFGIEMHASATAVLKNAGLSATETKNYPLGVKDLAPVLKGFKAAGVDMLVGLDLSPRQHPAHHPGQGDGLQPARLLHRGGHGVPVLSRSLQGRRGRLGNRGLESQGQDARARASTSRPT